MTNSLQTLKLAHELRLAGDLPTDVSFWAVENPLIHSTDRLKQKVCLLYSAACLQVFCNAAPSRSWFVLPLRLSLVYIVHGCMHK